MKRIVTFAALAVIRSISDAWAVWVLWGWFVVPLGIVPISFVHAMGLDLLVGFFFATAAPRRDTDNDSRDKDLSFAFAKVIIAPTIVGIGWIIQAVGI